VQLKAGAGDFITSLNRNNPPRKKVELKNKKTIDRYKLIDQKKPVQKNRLMSIQKAGDPASR
jgi:hypothetical protein